MNGKQIRSLICGMLVLILIDWSLKDAGIEYWLGMILTVVVTLVIVYIFREKKDMGISESSKEEDQG